MIEQSIDALLRVPSITTVVGSALALQQLAQGSTYPALVYQVVSSTAWQPLCSPGSTFQSRVQINPIAIDVQGVQSLQDLARAALERSTPMLVGASRVVSCRLLSFGPWTKDDFTGMWTQPADYMLIHE